SCMRRRADEGPDVHRAPRLSCSESHTDSLPADADLSLSCRAAHPIPAQIFLDSAHEISGHRFLDLLEAMANVLIAHCSALECHNLSLPENHQPTGLQLINTRPFSAGW